MTVRPRDWWGRRFAAAAAALTLAAGLASLALLPFLLPYWHVYADTGLKRTLADAAGFAVSWHAYLATPARLHFQWWSRHWFETDALFPGAVALVLAAVALVRGVALRDVRARMCLAAGVAGLYLSFGPKAPGYTTLYEWVPLLHAIRAIARFGYLVIMAVAVLAAFGVRELQRMLSPRLRPLLLIVPLLVAIDVSPTPIWYARFEQVPPIYQRLRAEAPAIVAELPFYPSGAEFLHARYMLNSTAHWLPMINGYSGFQPLSFHHHADALAAFPDPSSLADLQASGVTHLVVHASAYLPAALDALGRSPLVQPLASEDGIRIYRLTPQRPPAAR